MVICKTFEIATRGNGYVLFSCFHVFMFCQVEVQCGPGIVWV